MPDPETANSKLREIKPCDNSQQQIDGQHYLYCPFLECKDKRFKNRFARYYHLRLSGPLVECSKCHQSFTKRKLPGHSCQYSRRHAKKGPRPRILKNGCAQQWQRFGRTQRREHLERADSSGPHLRYDDNSHDKTIISLSLPFQAVSAFSYDQTATSLASESDVFPMTTLVEDTVCILALLHTVMQRR